METRTIQGKPVSLLGYGLMRLPRTSSGGSSEIDFEAASKLIDHAIASGINYFDTAYTYRGSEAFAGKALTKYPRESYFLATKCPPWMLKNEADFERIFNESLTRCQTSYFDFFLVHNLAQEAKRAASNDDSFDDFVKLGMYEMLQKKKAEGKIRHIGFSFHGTIDLIEKLTDKYQWDFAQIQLNYIDWKATDAKRQYEILSEHHIPVVIMEPLRGGVLATLNESSAKILKDAQPDASLASWGIRYAASLPNVLTVLSGMTTMEQLTDNIATMSDFQSVTDQEKELMEKAAVVYNQAGAVPCTGCEYCMPCPQGVSIPRIFSVYNHYRLSNFRIPFDNGYATFDMKEKASNCIQCGLCTQKCPQHIEIPAFMKEIDDFANTPTS